MGGRHLSFLTVTNTNSMKGKTVLITGASAGLGYETALDMARRGAKVIIGNRKTEGLKEKIEVTVPGSQVDVFKLDLSLKESVLDFCAKVKAGHDKIHVFINNAALVANPQYADEPYKKRMSADGKHEITMATNYIGHCILNEELWIYWPKVDKMETMPGLLWYHLWLLCLQVKCKRLKNLIWMPSIASMTLPLNMPILNMPRFSIQESWQEGSRRKESMPSSALLVQVLLILALFMDWYGG